MMVALRDVPGFKSCTVTSLPSIRNFLEAGTLKVLNSPVDILTTRRVSLDVCHHS